MTLSLILSQKGRDVITTAPHRTMREVAQVMSEKGIGAVLVVDAAKKLLGIVSERDIVRGLARNGAAMLDDAVSRHMTAQVTTATEATSVPDAMGRMTNGRFRHLPVVNGERVEGLISIGDLVKHRLSEMEHEHKAMLEYIATA